MLKVLVLNGPNLGRLGRREPAIYGRATYDDLKAHLIGTGAPLGLDVDVRQSDSEAEMLSWLHEAADGQIPVVLNPAAWTHYSIAVADAVAQVPVVIEVHISNVHAREPFRRHSVVSPYVLGVITGLGLGAYDLALTHIAATQIAADAASATEGDSTS